jgi:Outer membrane protein beta-barrel domain
VKQLCRYLPVLCLFALCVPFASAQSAFDINLGFGSFHNSANGGGLDSASSANAFGSCTPGSADTFCQATGGLGGFFLGFGGDVMFNRHFGAGFQASVQPAQSNYGPLQYRQSFYDVNGIYAPINRKRVVLQLLGGLGAARTSFSVSQSGCIGTAVCTSQTVPVGNASHFQIHTGVGVQIFLSEHIFVRPQFDFHYVPGFTNQFSSNAVPGGSIWVGYNFGER